MEKQPALTESLGPLFPSSLWKRGIIFFLILYSIFHLGYSILRYNPIVYDSASGDFLTIYQGVLDWRQTGEFRSTGWQAGQMIFPGGLLNQLPAHPLWGKQYSTMYWWSSLLVYGYGLLGLCILLCYRRLLQARGRNESA